MLEGERREMKSKVITGLMLTLLFVGMLTLAFNIRPAKAEPTTIIVPDDYEKIQWAIGNASDGDTILVRAETYYENIVVDKMVDIQSVSGSSVTKVVAYNASDHVFHVIVNHVNISGFTVMGATGVAPPYPNWKSGILLDNVSYCNISNNILINNNYGIYLYKAVNNTISGNIAWNNSDGFYLYLTTMKTGYCIIKNNTANSSKWSGFYVYASLYQNITLINNTANWNGKHGLFLEQCPEETIVHNTMSWNNGSGIYLCLSDRNTIRNNEISNNKIGINLGEEWAGSSGNAIYHNNFIDNENQVYMYESVNNTWDNGYPSGGNYWSDHVCTGNPSDGSQPYIIDANNTDHYPFQDSNGWLHPVGGIYIPVNKLELLAPYIGLTILLAVAVISVVYVKKRKRQ